LFSPLIVKSDAADSNSWGQHGTFPVHSWRKSKTSGIQVSLKGDSPDRNTFVESNSSSWRPSHIWQEDNSLPAQETQYDFIPVCNWGEPKSSGVQVPLEQQDIRDETTLTNSNSSSWRPSQTWQKDDPLPEQAIYAPVSDEKLKIISSEQLEVSKLCTDA
jgi:hypothetical protein